MLLNKKNPLITFLLPTKSNYSNLENENIIKNIIKIKNDLNFDKLSNFNLIIGLDSNDHYFNNNLFFKNEIIFKLDKKKYHDENGIFHICKAWNDMAIYAFNELNTDITIFIGDDIEIINKNGWYNDIINAFKLINKNTLEGIVILKEYYSPGWPCFPAITKSHFILFDYIFPNEFINQDADPYIYELYRRFNMVRYTKTIILKNKIGGLSYNLIQPKLENNNEPRYKPVNIEWKTNILKNSIKKMKLKNKIDNIITFDIGIPCYRVNIERLEYNVKILNKSAKMLNYVSIRINIIIDRNRNDLSLIQKDKLEKLNYQYDNVRIRINESNLGASFTRTRILNECHSDYVLFLDDDVIVTNNLLEEYIKAIEKNKYNDNIIGYIGLSKLKFDNRISTNAFNISQQTYFWYIANQIQNPPW